jgi:iron complex outermembrane recepter protein
MRSTSAVDSGDFILDHMRSWIAPLMIAIAAFTSAAAYAQMDPSSSDKTEAPAPAGAQEAGIPEIIVTAQRREESLQRAAVAVTAITGDDIVAAGVSDTANLNRLVPALQVLPSGGGAMNFYLRGVGTLQATAYGENPVAYNFNGVYISQPTAAAGAFYDLERIEVVKGPQGTLYGRNATGGAINVLPKRPELGKFSGDATVEYGNYDSKKILGAVNLPLGATAALRIAGQWVDRDGYLSDGYDDEKGQAARASLLFKPSDRWSAMLMADYFHQGGKGLGSVVVPSSYNPNAAPIGARIGGADPRSLAEVRQWADSTLPAPPFCPGGLVSSGCVGAAKGDGYIDSTFYGVSATIEADLGFANLTVIPAYRRSEPEYRFYSIGFLGEESRNDEQKSLEARLASNGEGRFSYVVGAYLFDEHQHADEYYAPGALSTTRTDPALDTTSKALFGQATYHVSEAFRLVGGLRYTEETRKQAVSVAAGNIFDPNPPLSEPPFSGHLDFHSVTWKAGLEWDAAAHSLVYANAATGFKAGGFFAAAAPNNSYAPEKLTAYTLGSKNRLLDNRLQANIEVFYWDYKNQQITFIGGIDTPTGIGTGAVTVNAGQAHMYGTELELLFAATRNDRLGVTLQYLKGKYDSLAYNELSPTGGPVRTGCATTNLGPANPGTPDPAQIYRTDCSGKPTLNSPEWTSNLSYEHTFMLGSGYVLAPGVRARIETSREITIDYIEETKQEAYTITDAYLTLTPPSTRWSLSAFVNNIGDETVKASAVPHPILQTVYSAVRPPRTYGARFGYHF